MKRLPLLSVLLTLTVCVNAAVAQTVFFQENFDSSAYTTGGSLPTTLGVIDYGRWANDSKSPGSATTVAGGVALSSPHALALTAGSAAEKAQATAYFGTDNETLVSTSEAIEIKLAFRLTKSTNKAVVYVGNSASTSIASVSLGGGGSNVLVSFASGDVSIGDVLGNTWYYLTLNLPENATSASQWTASLYDQGMALIGSQSGQFKGSPTTLDYRYLAMYNTYAGTTAYFDNVSVHSIPETGSIAMLFGGAGLCAMRVFRSRGK